VTTSAATEVNYQSKCCFGTEIKLIYWLKHKQSTIKFVAQSAFKRVFQ